MSRAADPLPDDILLRRVRGGDMESFAILYERHQDAALRLARSWAGGGDPEGIVADAFERVLVTLVRGEGPTRNFRGYLFSCIRNLGRAQGRKPLREVAASDQPHLLDTAVSGRSSDDLCDSAAGAAFLSLPRSWREVLWWLEVEGRRPAEVAARLGIRVAAVSALAYRARAGLRRSYVAQLRLRELP